MKYFLLITLSLSAVIGFAQKKMGPDWTISSNVKARPLLSNQMDLMPTSSFRHIGDIGNKHVYMLGNYTRRWRDDAIAHDKKRYGTFEVGGQTYMSWLGTVIVFNSDLSTDTVFRIEGYMGKDKKDMAYIHIASASVYNQKIHVYLIAKNWDGTALRYKTFAVNGEGNNSGYEKLAVLRKSPVNRPDKVGDAFTHPVICTISRDGRYLWVAGRNNIYRHDRQTGEFTTQHLSGYCSISQAANTTGELAMVLKKNKKKWDFEEEYAFARMNAEGKIEFQLCAGCGTSVNNASVGYAGEHMYFAFTTLDNDARKARLYSRITGIQVYHGTTLANLQTAQHGFSETITADPEFDKSESAKTHLDNFLLTGAYPHNGRLMLTLERRETICWYASYSPCISFEDRSRDEDYFTTRYLPMNLGHLAVVSTSDMKNWDVQKYFRESPRWMAHDWEIKTIEPMLMKDSLRFVSAEGMNAVPNGTSWPAQLKRLPKKVVNRISILDPLQKADPIQITPNQTFTEFGDQTVSADGKTIHFTYRKYEFNPREGERAVYRRGPMEIGTCKFTLANYETNCVSFAKLPSKAEQKEEREKK